MPDSSWCWCQRWTKFFIGCSFHSCGQGTTHNTNKIYRILVVSAEEKRSVGGRWFYDFHMIKMQIKRTIMQLKEHKSNKWNNKGHDAKLITHHLISPHLPCNSPILCLLLFVVIHIHILHTGLGFCLLPIICNLLLNFYVYYEHLICLYIHIALFWIF